MSVHRVDRKSPWSGQTDANDPEADIDAIERQRDDGRIIAAARKSGVAATVRAAES
jgi:hypothetical protein